MKKVIIVLLALGLALAVAGAGLAANPGPMPRPPVRSWAARLTRTSMPIARGNGFTSVAPAAWGSSSRTRRNT